MQELAALALRHKAFANNSASFAFYAKQSLAVHYLTPVLSQTLAKFIRVYLPLYHLNRRVSITKEVICDYVRKLQEQRPLLITILGC